MAEPECFRAQGVRNFTSNLIKPLFGYGSIVPAIASHIIDGVDSPIDQDKTKSPTAPATLHGFRCFRRKDCCFPAVLDCFPGFLVRGLVPFGLTSSQRGRIGGFEKGLYSRETHEAMITLVSRGGTGIDADVYVWAGDRELFSETDGKGWSLDELLRTRFCREYLG